MIKLLLLEGYNRENITTAEQAKLILDFELLVNSSVLDWRLNTGQDQDNRVVIGDQSMPNTHVRRFLDHFEDLAELCLVDED